MANTPILVGETTDGASGAVAISGRYTVHVRGSFDRQAGTIVRGFVSPTGQEDYAPLGDLQFYKPGSKNIEFEGSVKFVLYNPGASTGVDVSIEGPI